MIVKRISIKIALILLCAVVLFSACSSKTPTASPEKVQTLVAQTVAVQLTKTEIARPTDTPTPLPTATATLPPPTPTATVEETKLPESSATAAPITGVERGDWAASDPKDDSTQSAGVAFKVKVSIVNNGTTTWTTDYYIKYLSGERMSAPDTIKMPYAVPPKQTVVLEIPYVAPAAAGTVKTNWGIVNANNVAFSTFYTQYIIQ